jgi:hypothetical protein
VTSLILSSSDRPGAGVNCPTGQVFRSGNRKASATIALQFGECI